MLRNKWIALPLVLLAFAMFANAGPYTITVTGALGPNYSGGGTPYDTFAADVITAVQAGNQLVGGGTYSPVSVIYPNQPIVSNFESWQGTVDPGSGVYGTGLYFVLHITAPDAPFTLSQLRYDETDPPDVFPTATYSFGSYSGFSSDLLGWNGSEWITSGDASTPVTGLIYVGEMVGWAAANDSGQAGLDAVRDYLAGFAGMYVTGKYTLVSAGSFPGDAGPLASGQADVQFEGIPEPGTIALAAMGLAAMLFVRRKR
jgi:hypothetical protein